MNEIKIIIEGLDSLTEALRVLAGIKSAENSNAIPTMPNPAPVPQNTVPVSTPQNYGQMLGQPVQPGGMVAPTGIPTTATQQNYTLEQLQVAAAGLSSMGKMAFVIGILQKFGIQAMTELPQERYGEFATALREAGAQI